MIELGCDPAGRHKKRAGAPGRSDRLAAEEADILLEASLPGAAWQRQA